MKNGLDWGEDQTKVCALWLPSWKRTELKSKSQSIPGCGSGKTRNRQAANDGQQGQPMMLYKSDSASTRIFGSPYLP